MRHEALAARLERVTPAVDADLRVLNDGALDAAVSTLGAWWRSLARTGR